MTAEEFATRFQASARALWTVAAGILGRALGDPIRNLTDTATRIAAGQRSAAFPKPSGREAR